MCELLPRIEFPGDLQQHQLQPPPALAHQVIRPDLSGPLGQWVDLAVLSQFRRRGTPPRSHQTFVKSGTLRSLSQRLLDDGGSHHGSHP